MCNFPRSHTRLFIQLPKFIHASFAQRNQPIAKSIVAKLSTICTWAFIILGTLFLSCASALAQLQPPSDPSSEHFSPGRGMTPTGSYALSDIESINMTNGNLGVHIPLASLPSGRGGMSAGLALYYNSKIFDIRSVTSVPARSDGTPESRRYNLNHSQDGNWRYGFRYELRLEERDYPILTSYNQNYVPCNNFNAIYYYKVFMVFPDGSKHELRLRDHDDWEGYFAYRPGGGTTNHCSTVQPLTGKMVYYSMDGTYLRLEVEHDPDPTFGNVPWTLYMPDGSKVQGGSSALQRVTDRNNNYFEILSNTTYNGHVAVKIEDQLTRKIILEYGSASNEDSIHASGFAGAEIITKIKWKTVSVVRSYNNGEGNVPLLGRFRTVIDKINLPSQLGGLAYTFGYNAPDYDFSAPNNDLPVGWGELSSITTPLGATASYSYALDGLITGSPETVLTNSIKQKELTYDQQYDGSSTSVTDTWSYVFDRESGTTTMTGPDGGVTHIFYNGGEGILPAWFSDLTYRTEAPDGSVSEQLWDRNTPAGHPVSFYADNPYVKTEFRSIPNTSGTLQTAIKNYTYDKNGNLTKVEEYDWVPYASVPRSAGKPTGIPAGILPKRITLSKFFGETPEASDNSTADSDAYQFVTAPHLLRAVASSEISDATLTLTRVVNSRTTIHQRPETSKRVSSGIRLRGTWLRERML
jgi:hypothetical protein